MSHLPIKILLIESISDDACLIQEMMREANENFSSRHVTTLSAGINYLEKENFHVLLLNLLLLNNQPPSDIISRMQARSPNTSIIILTTIDNEQQAAQTIYNGAQDYLIKERLTSHNLSHAIRNALGRQQAHLKQQKKAQDLSPRFRAIIEQNTNGIMVVNEQGTIQFANRAAQTILGPNLTTLQNTPINYPLSAGETTEINIVRPQNNTTIANIVEIQVAEVEWGGQPSFMITLHNITERVKTEEALIKERNLLRTVIDNLPDNVYVKNLEGKFIAVNLATMRNLNAKSLIDVIGKTDADFYSPDYAMQSHTEERELLHTGQAIINHEESILDHKTNQKRWILSSKIPLRNREGKITGLVGIKRDITERRKAEIALKKEHDLLALRVDERTTELREANNKLTHALRVKDEFLTSMSHELRTPLNAILGMAEILIEEVYGPLNDHQTNSANIIQESGRHLLALINDILDVSRIEADKLALDLSTVSVEAICNASIRFVQQTARKKDIKITVNYSNAQTTLMADERRLKQILVNLLSNAAKFTPTGGKLGLDVTTNKNDGTINFVVWDTGIGIAKENMSKLFQPFVQLDSRLSRQYEGTGLGLALVYLLAQLHGATVSLKSEVGKGSRFTVSFPWKKTDPALLKPKITQKPTITATSPTLSPHNPMILLAEDNIANIEVMTGYLAAKGYRVITAHDGVEVIKRAKKLHPDLILMDVHMPEIDGIEATRQIRADANLAKIPIIALTALAMPGDRERCLNAGMNIYLSKPVSLRNLTQIMETLLQK